MDLILDCVFVQVFAKLDRGCLLARYKRRQLADYLGTVILGSSGSDTQDGCRRAVLAAMRFHSSSRQANGHICLLGKFHNVLYVAATLCFDWNLQDTEVVVQLLKDIYTCENTFERLFVGAILGTKVTHLISGWKSDFRSRDECVNAVKYFLEHASTVGLQFDCSGELTNFVDVPMVSYGNATALWVSTQTSRPDILQVLLDYGATVSPQPQTCVIRLLLRRMNEFCTDSPEVHIPPNFISCLKLLLREIPMLPTIIAGLEDVSPEVKDPNEVLQTKDIHPTIYSLVPDYQIGYISKHTTCKATIHSEVAFSIIMFPYLLQFPSPIYVAESCSIVR